jgi:hypothetical protein
VQTFMPYPDFVDTAKVLDYRRLGKQRVEAKQIILALERGSGGWINHPAVRMWRGYESSLSIYGLVMCKEWIRRGYKDTTLPFFDERVAAARFFSVPEWTDDPALVLSHRSNLVRKDPEYYGPLFPGVPDDLPYLWPVTA